MKIKKNRMGSADSEYILHVSKEELDLISDSVGKNLSDYPAEPVVQDKLNAMNSTLVTELQK